MCYRKPLNTPDYIDYFDYIRVFLATKVTDVTIVTGGYEQSWSHAHGEIFPY